MKFLYPLHIVMLLTLMCTPHLNATSDSAHEHTTTQNKQLPPYLPPFSVRAIFELKALFYQALLEYDYGTAQAIIAIISKDLNRLYDAAYMQEELDVAQEADAPWWDGTEEDAPQEEGEIE